MSTIFVVAFLVLLFGVFKPYKGFKRWQFGLAAFVSFMLIGVFAPGSQDAREKQLLSSQNGAEAESALSAAEMEAIEKKNGSRIAKLRSEVSKLPASDVVGNLRLYKQLAALAPGNAAFAKKVGEYETRLAARDRYADNPEEALSIVDWNWNTGGFGSIMEISKLTVRNDAPFAIKDFKLHCIHSGNSGTEINKNTRVQFELIPANSERTFRNINMGFISSQAASSSCEITHAVKAG